MADSAPLVVDRVSKHYGDVVAVDDVSLTVPAGRFLTLLGPSGSGKTTLLMMMAGFVQPTSGALRFGQQDITALPPEKRDFGMVFQGYALFPHLSARENIAFPLRLRRRPEAEITRAVDRMLELVQLPALGARMPRQLSGGQQQRVALARALVFSPRVLLLDEPLSALDKKLRGGLQEELRELHQRLGTTFIFVTHDQDEALSMSDEIAIVNGGRIVQQGRPTDLYERPASHFVADFLGKSNFIEGVIDSIEPQALRYATRAGNFVQRRTDTRQTVAGQPILVGLRPEKITLSDLPPSETANRLAGRIVSHAYHGTDFQIRIETALGTLLVVVATWKATLEPAAGRSVWLSWDDDASVILDDDRNSKL